MDTKQEWKKRVIKSTLLILALPVLFAGLNFQQLYSAWAVWSETQRLAGLARNATDEFENPAPLTEDFENGLSTEFWDFTIINGAGLVSNETAWHAAEMTVDHQLTLRHVQDPEFSKESAKWRVPASEQYNNVTLIGGKGFQPTPSGDVVVEFKSRVDESFYGTAGVVLQPAGTLQADGMFTMPFDMFGLSMIGSESSFNGVNGAVCYLALNWAPAQVESLSVDAEQWQTYQIRLHRISKTEWLGTMSVDGTEMCRVKIPAFGPLEIQVWSDNYLLNTQPRRWWQIAPALGLGFQDGGDKGFYLDDIRIFEEAQ